MKSELTELQYKSTKQNSRMKEKLNEKDQRVLKCISISTKKTTTIKVTTELNQYFDTPVSVLTVQRQLHKQKV